MAGLRSDNCPVRVASLQAVASVGLKVAIQGGLTALNVACWLGPLKSNSFVESPAGEQGASPPAVAKHIPPYSRLSSARATLPHPCHQP